MTSEGLSFPGIVLLSMIQTTSKSRALTQTRHPDRVPVDGTRQSGNLDLRLTRLCGEAEKEDRLSEKLRLIGLRNTLPLARAQMCGRLQPWT